MATRIWCSFLHNGTYIISYRTIVCLICLFIPYQKRPRGQTKTKIFALAAIVHSQNKTSAQALSLKDGTILLIDVFSAFRCSYSILQIWKRRKNEVSFFATKWSCPSNFYVHKPNRICISQIWKYILFPSWVYFQESPYKNWPVLCTQKPHYNFFFA